MKMIMFADSVWSWVGRPSERYPSPIFREMPDPLPREWRIAIPPEIKMTVKTAMIEVGEIEPNEVKIKLYDLVKAEGSNDPFYLLRNEDALCIATKLEKSLDELYGLISQWREISFRELESKGLNPYGGLQFQNDINIPGYYHDLIKSVRKAKAEFIEEKSEKYLGKMQDGTGRKIVYYYD
jgi:hypothetical protein